MKKRHWLAILCAMLALALTAAAASADTGDEYKLIKDVSGLHDGDRILLVSDDGNYYQAMATDFSGVQVTVTSNSITEQNGMLVLTLAETNGGWLFAADGGYLAVNESTLTVVSDQADAAVWSISIASDGTATISCADGNLVFTEQDGAYRFSYGTGGNEISVYGTSLQPGLHALGNGLWWTYIDGKLTIEGSGEMPDFASSTSQPWATLRDGIAEVEIKDDITNIGDWAFCNCTNLSSITIPCSAAISQHAFENCIAVTSVHLSEGSGAMADYTWYPNYTYRYTPWYISRNNELTITLDDGIESISSYTFYECVGLKSISIPDSVTSIGNSAFSGCTGLSEITLPDSVTSIGWSAFFDCTTLTSIIIGENVTTIGMEAFYNTEWWNAQNEGLVYMDYILLGVKGTCGQIIQIKEGTRLIASNALAYKSQIIKVTIPNGVVNIGDSAFCECTSLSSVAIPDSVTRIGYNAFYGCAELLEIIIPDSVTYIGQSAFYNCIGLDSVTLPCSTIIGSAFSGCTSITNVHLTKGTGTMTEYSLDNQCTPWYQSRNNQLTISLDEGIQNISEFAFRGCTGLTEITIPNSITSIGVYAFKDCTGLVSIAIGNNVNSISSQAFSGCTSLTEIMIPDCVTYIGEHAFSGCTRLQSITMPCSARIDNIAFRGCTAITNVSLTVGTGTMVNYSDYEYTPWYISRNNALSVTLADGIQNISNNAFKDCTGLTSIIIPDSVTCIGQSAFHGCTELMEITVGSGVTSIDYSAFCNCKRLTSIIVPDRVTSIGSNAFRGCTGLTSFTMPDSVTSFGGATFFGCTGLTSITISNNVTNIGSSVFYDCTGLTQITIPDNVTSIEGSAFRGCTGLHEITIPVSVTNIERFAFYGCTELKDVYYGGMPTDRENNLTIDSDNGSLLNATWHYALEVTTQPKSVTVASGKTAKFTVKATGSDLTYQWYYSKNNGKEWIEWSGKTSDTVTVKASATTNGYLYRCVAKNTKYTETSESAKLTVSGVKPKIVVQPKAATVKTGKSNTFKVVAAGSGLKYQWYYSKDNGTKWTKMSGKTTASLKVKGSATTNGYLYRCKITNTKGSVTSKSVKLTVSGVKPKIVVQPKAVSVKSGKTAKFSVVAAGTGLKYQWYYSKNAGKTWTKMSGKTAATLSVKGSKTNNGYLYRCVVKNTKGSVTSKNAKLTVK